MSIQVNRDPSLHSGYRTPEELRSAIEQETRKVERRTLARAVAELTEAYKAAGSSSPIMRTEAHRAAYLATRVPATYAACSRVFQEIRRLAPGVGIGSALDLGAGPGTALWAATETFPGLGHATLIESDAAWVNLGKRMMAGPKHSLLRETQWRNEDLRGARLTPHDLVVVSYVLGELSSADADALVHRAWSAASQFLVIVEPGTPRGFSAVHAARAAMIAADAQILAPCPNRLPCPMAAAGDWCHFSQRVERTSLHRQLKGGELPYEDEKFSYLVASRSAPAPGLARIVRHPRKNPGHVHLKLCVDGQVESRTITRSHKEDYKLARRAQWGDTWKS